MHFLKRFFGILSIFLLSIYHLPVEADSSQQVKIKEPDPMFIAIITYIRPFAEVEAVIPEHLEYLQNLFDQKKLLVCGRQNPWIGGVIISQNVLREEFEKMMQEDPFTKAGVSEFQIVEFIPKIYDECLKEMIEKPANTSAPASSFAAIYQGYIKPGRESEYQENWNKIANYFVAHRGAIGSCLHRTSDGLMVAYSRWPNKAMRDASWPGENAPSEELPSEIQNAISVLKNCMDHERKIPEISMEVINDLLLR